MKRKLMIICSLIVTCAIFSAGTLAYTTRDTEVENVVTAGNLELEIHEMTADGKEFSEEDIYVLPGDKISRIVAVENIGNQPMYLRVKLVKSVDDEALSAEDCIDLDINTKDWTYREGYYYYNTVLEAGNTTEPLMTEVCIDGREMDNEYLGKELSLEITAEAVQSANNGATVFEAAGWVSTTVN